MVVASNHQKSNLVRTSTHNINAQYYCVQTNAVIEHETTVSFLVSFPLLLTEAHDKPFFFLFLFDQWDPIQDR